MTTLPYSQEIRCALPEDAAAGAMRTQLDALTGSLMPVAPSLRQRMEAGELPLFTLPAQTEKLPAIIDAAQQLKAAGTRLIVLGTGGSSLGAQTLVALAGSAFVPPPVCCVDSIDPHTVQALLRDVPLESSCFLFVSKSGTTVETLTQALLIVRAIEERLGKPEVGKRCRAITVPGANPLRRLAEAYGIPMIDHDPKLGGRFSVFSEVGLLPAAFAGLDIAALCRGAAQVVTRTLGASSAAACEAMEGAALGYALLAQGKTISVLMPYCDRLASFGLWYRQCWAESLGKQGKGSTPIRAMGPVDQHSQLQLYLDGPRDKYFTLMLTETKNTGPLMDSGIAGDPALDYLHGRTPGDVMAALAEGTRATLVQAGCPVRVLNVPHLDEASLGALIMHFMFEIVFMAHLLNVDPFDQPAVEAGKILARIYLKRMGMGM